MSDHHEVSITQLLTISEKLIKSFFPSSDFYSLLVLALVTITTYSRNKNRLSPQTRIDLTIAFIPDLIKFLIEQNTISSEVAKDLTKEYEQRRDELPLILRAYMYVSGGLHIKMKIKDEDASKQCIIS